MILPVFFQGSLFLGAVAAGFILAFIYDIFRMMRRIIPHSGIFIQLQDMIYWILVVAAMFYFLLSSNSGEIRFFTIAGTFIGMIVYYKLVSPIFLKASLTIYSAVKRVVLLLAAIILAPFKAVLRILSYPAAFLGGYAKRAYAYEKKVYKGVKLRGKNKTRKLKNNLKIILKKI